MPSRCFMWKDINGYEGYYQVSDNGYVRSLDRYITDNKGITRFLKGKIMKQSICHSHGSEDGYYVVNLHKNHVSNVLMVHLLVACAFIPNPLDLPIINHKDGDKKNNSVSNLEWSSYSYNNIHALENNLRQPRGNIIGQYSISGELIKKYKSICEAARKTGFGRSSISHCVNKRQSSYKGFIWSKIPEGQTTIPIGSTPEDELLAEAQKPL